MKEKKNELLLSKDIGDLLRQIRNIKQMSQAQVAGTFGKPQSWVSKMEAGGETTNMTLKTLEILLNGLEIKATLRIKLNDPKGNEYLFEMPIV
ncbi:helix-turn-helix domain-containing protein [Pontibacter sp. MBLB2868]|uniref:helix-turn-helix domain-containing protein n=1 Tax=Pontibacter sp. MBLB2868 TaxID=3451555 RepID=UPI003F750BD3